MKSRPQDSRNCKISDEIMIFTARFLKKCRFNAEATQHIGVAVRCSNPKMFYEHSLLLHSIFSERSPGVSCCLLEHREVAINSTFRDTVRYWPISSRQELCLTVVVIGGQSGFDYILINLSLFDSFRPIIGSLISINVGKIVKMKFL